MELKELLAALSDMVIEGQPEHAAELVAQGLAAKHDPLTMIDEGLRPGMDEVGDRFAKNECFLPDLVMSGKAMQAAIDALEPALKANQQQRAVAGRVVLGTVQGDIHEIGKNLVRTMFSANGFKVYDLGVDVSPDQFVQQVREGNADVVGMSTLLTTTMRNQRAVIEALVEAGLRERVTVLVGGAPTSPEWAEEIGADAHAENATEGVRLARTLLGAG